MTGGLLLIATIGQVRAMEQGISETANPIKDNQAERYCTSASAQGDMKDEETSAFLSQKGTEESNVPVQSDSKVIKDFLNIYLAIDVKEQELIELSQGFEKFTNGSLQVANAMADLSRVKPMIAGMADLSHVKSTMDNDIITMAEFTNLVIQGQIEMGHKVETIKSDLVDLRKKLSENTSVFFRAAERKMALCQKSLEQSKNNEKDSLKQSKNTEMLHYFDDHFVGIVRALDFYTVSPLNHAEKMKALVDVFGAENMLDRHVIAKLQLNSMMLG